MQWNHLTEDAQLNKIILNSQDKPQVIFKHSTRCSISSVALNRFKNIGDPLLIDFHLLDLIAFRSLSNKIAETFQIQHESPQILMIIKGDCIYEETHLAISPDELFEQIPQ